MNFSIRNRLLNSPSFFSSPEAIPEEKLPEPGRRCKVPTQRAAVRRNLAKAFPRAEPPQNKRLSFPAPYPSSVPARAEILPRSRATCFNMGHDYTTSDDDSNSGSDTAADPLPQKFAEVPSATVRDFPVKRLVIDHRSSKAHTATEPDVTPLSPPLTPGVPSGRACNPGNHISVGDRDYLWSVFNKFPYPSHAMVTDIADTRGLTSADVNRWFSNAQKRVITRVTSVALTAFRPARGSKLHPDNPLVRAASTVVRAQPLQPRGPAGSRAAPEQQRYLWTQFEADPCVSQRRGNTLARAAGMETKDVMRWFHNTQQRVRRQIASMALFAFSEDGHVNHALSPPNRLVHVAVTQLRASETGTPGSAELDRLVIQDAIRKVMVRARETGRGPRQLRRPARQPALTLTPATGALVLWKPLPRDYLPGGRFHRAARC